MYLISCLQTKSKHLNLLNLFYRIYSPTNVLNIKNSKSHFVYGLLLCYRRITNFIKLFTLNFINKSSFLTTYYKRNELLWNDGLIIDFLQKKSADLFIRKFVIFTGFIFSERLVFETVVKIYIDNLVWPSHRISIFESGNVSETLSLILALLFFLIILLYLSYFLAPIHEMALLLSLVCVLLTLFVVLTERKLLAFAQRRMGPTLMGRNGAFQILADLFKMLTKEIFMIPRPTTVAAPIFLSLLFVTQLLFSLNFIWGPSMFIVDSVDSMILYHLILILLSNIFFSVVGLISHSRYAIIGTVRGLVHVISLDIFVTVLYSLLVLISQSTNFHDFVLLQTSYWNILLYFPAASGFIVVLFLESKRAPFDHSETESEVVAGYSTEYNGPMLLMFFLAEYLHLIIAAIHFSLFFIGGWLSLDLFSFTTPVLSSYHNTRYLVF